MRLLIKKALEQAARYLPIQGALKTFVHHNTLHAFELMPFDKAVISASEIYGTEPFMTEESYAQCLKNGRISSDDIDQIVDEEYVDDNELIFPNGPSRQDLKKIRLNNYFSVPTGKLLDWTISERLFYQDKPDLKNHELEKLWDLFSKFAPEKKSPRIFLRSNNLAANELIHPIIIKFSAVFVDQGVAYWTLPNKELGFLGAFRTLYAQNFGPPDPWLNGLQKELKRQENLSMDAEDTIIWALQKIHVSSEKISEYFLEILLSLKGWAGFIRQLELNKNTKAKLIDYLAVSLILEVFALNYIKKQKTLVADNLTKTNLGPNLELAYEAIMLAQICGLGLDKFHEANNIRSWLLEIESFDSNQRRYILHLAYEQKYRNEIIDSIAKHAKTKSPNNIKASLQAVFCIDAREESLRRHLEEIDPKAQTFGYAGFFGVAMNYQGLEDISAQALCPVVITPKHLIQEYAVRTSEHKKFLTKRKRQGQWANMMNVSSKTLIRGSLVSATLGPLSSISLLGRCLFPRLTAKFMAKSSQSLAKKPLTRLSVEKNPNNNGYNIEEMTNIVKNMLKTIGLVENYSPIVLVVGHGSSSMNNPHEAAYNCGATGGGHGGPNARAFAMMANHPQVREKLKIEHDILVSEQTWFLATSHNTCDDSMTYYDEDMLPEALKSRLLCIKANMEKACQSDAHERCRRFCSAPKDKQISKTIIHAEERANDFSQTRPEYGNCTNAVLVVGKRDLSKDLFLDRRAFLSSYDQSIDKDAQILESLLLAVIPVCSGINLQYYFSFVDVNGYGCGSKLSHNIVSMVGVMDGHASDLRTGLAWQQVDIHEPVRLITVVESDPDILLKVLLKNQQLFNYINNSWIWLLAIDPKNNSCFIFKNGEFHKFTHKNKVLSSAKNSVEHYWGKPDHLPVVSLNKTVFAKGQSCTA